MLVFANTTIDKFGASQFKLNLDRSALTLSFSDNFNTLDLRHGDSGTWDTNFWWGAANGSTLTQNGERQWYIDADYGPTSSVHPFSIDDGVLTITAARAPAAVRPYINNYEYTSGLLTTFESFSQTYGYFEIRADMPEKQGVWPAFWLLPADGSWPPELDVIEMVGQDPSKLILTAHSNQTGSHTVVSSNAFASNTAGFHTYGVLWTPQATGLVFRRRRDGARRNAGGHARAPCTCWSIWPSGVWPERRPMGSSTPAEMQIDYIRAYTIDDLNIV